MNYFNLYCYRCEIVFDISISVYNLAVFAHFIKKLMFNIMLNYFYL